MRTSKWLHFQKNDRAGWLRMVLVYASWLVAFGLALWMGFHITLRLNQWPVIWPMAGVATAGVYIFGWRMALAMTLMFVVALRYHPHVNQWPLAAALALLWGLGVLWIVWVLRRWRGFRPELSRPRDVLALVVGGGVIGLLPASIMIALLDRQIHPEMTYHDWTAYALTRWMVYFLGLIVVFPLIMVWWHSRPSWLERKRWLEGAGVLFLNLLAGWVVYFEGFNAVASYRPWNYLMVLVLILVVFRFGRHGTTLSLVILFAFTVLGTMVFRGPFTDYSEHERSMEVWLFMTVVTVSSLLLMSTLASHQQTAARLKQVNEELSSLIRAAPLGIVMVEGEGLVQLWNPAAESIFGWKASEVQGIIPPSISPDHLAQARAFYDSVRDSNQARIIETKRLRKDGRMLDVRIYAAPMHDEEGRIISIMSIIEDITIQKTTEQTQRDNETRTREMSIRLHMLLRELDHRVKNNLAGLYSLVDIYAAKAPSAAALAASLRDKLMAMKAAHVLIAEAGWQAVDLSVLLRGLAAQFVGDPEVGQVFTYAGPALKVSPRQVAPLAMVFQELFTNSRKHGALRESTGKIRLTWNWSQATGSRRKVHMDWSEHDGPPSAIPASEGQGITLIRGFCRFELAGDCRFDFTPQGLHCELNWSCEETTTEMDPAKVIV